MSLGSALGTIGSIGGNIIGGPIGGQIGSMAGSAIGGAISGDNSAASGGTFGNLYGAQSGGLGNALTAAQYAQLMGNNYGMLQGNVAPFISTGQGANQQMWNELQSGAMGQAFNPTMQQLQQTPGYQFQLQQGLESVQNAAAARGLGVSGAALKGAGNFASGLAAANYQQQFNDYWANQLNRYNMLAGLSNTGAQVAVGSMPGLNTAAQLYGQGITGISNALTTGAQNLQGLAGSALSGNTAAQSLMQQIGLNGTTNVGNLGGSVTNAGGSLSGLGNQVANWFGGGTSALNQAPGGLVNSPYALSSTL